MTGNHTLSPEVRRLYPFASRFFDRNGLRYHYVDEGRGEPVVMVHGNPTWSFYYRNLISGLSPDHRALAVDHIGCGLSDKPPESRYEYRFQNRVDDLTAFLDHLDLSEKITLIVHDWGGAIGLGYAVNHPERIGRLVILNTAAFFPPADKGLPWRLRIVRNVRPFAGPAVLGLNAFAKGALYMAAKKKLSPAVKAGLIAPYDTWSNRLATLRFVQDIPLVPGDPSYQAVKRVEDGLPRLAGVPMLILWGRRDFVFDGWYFGEWRRRFPDAQAHEYENAGHYLLEDEPEDIPARVRAFIHAHPLGPR